MQLREGPRHCRGPSCVQGPPLRRLLVLTILVLAACSREERTTARASQPAVPVFIISIDTLRSDRLPVYGYAKGSTPNIDRFRRDAILYRFAFSNCPQTLPAHASVMTGLLPPAHGVRDNIGYRLQGVETLASRLQARGYRSGAAVSTYVLRQSTGIGAGFEFFDDTFEAVPGRPMTDAERDGEKARLALQRWLDSVPSRKVFGFLHLYEPHAPYEAPNGFRSVDDPYDNEIAYADAVVGRFLENLRERGLYDDALILVLSDHGEGLGEHGEDEHGVFVYRESLQVPLFVKLPGAKRAGQIVERPAGLDEVFPTVLRVIGEDPADPRDLLNDADRRDVYSESYFARLHFGWSELRSVVSGGRHFIDAPAPEIYDYAADPRELRNLADSERRTVFALQKKARETDTKFQEPSEVDPEDQRKLAALGYIGSGGSSSTPIDPKTKVQVMRDLRRAFLLVKAERFREALPLLEKFVVNEPGMIDGWGLLGRSRAETGRAEDALVAYREGLRRFPGNTSLALAAAQVYADLGRWEEAVQHAELALTRDPVVSHEMLARFAARRDDLALAEKHARAALGLSPSRTATLVLMADIMRRGANPAREIGYLDQARHLISSRSQPPVEGLEFRRGEALLSLRRVADAEAAFRAEVSAFPANRNAWSSLAVVLAARGQRADARAVLREALRLNPDAPMRRMARESLEAAGDREGLRLLGLDRH